LRPVTPTPARHKTALRCFHQSSSCPGAGHRGQERGRGDLRDRAEGSGPAPAHEPRKSRHGPPTGFRRLPCQADRSGAALLCPGTGMPARDGRRAPIIRPDARPRLSDPVTVSNSPPA
jgi:hypothetical protein